MHFYCTTNKNPLSYSVGEEMIFSLAFFDEDKRAACPKIKWQITGDDGQHSDGIYDSADGTVTFKAKMSKCGFLHLTAAACDENGEQIPDSKLFTGGACADLADVIEFEQEPADFNSFWEGQITDLNSVAPVLLDKKEIHTTYSHLGTVYDVKIACLGPRPVSGYLWIPKNAAPKSLSAKISFMGYSKCGADLPEPSDMIQLNLNPHGIDNGREDKYYKELEQGELKAFGFDRFTPGVRRNNDPYTVYFRYMILRALQGSRFIKTLEEWNESDLISIGGSMGGMQAIALAAFDRDVSLCDAAVPWLCDLIGIKYGRLSGWRPDIDTGILYYDTAYFAKRVTCPTVLEAGLGDYLCPPSSVTVTYKNLKGPKKLVYYQGMGHQRWNGETYMDPFVTSNSFEESSIDLSSSKNVLVFSQRDIDSLKI